MVNRVKFTVEKKQQILEKIQEFASITKACECCGVSTRGFYDHKNADEDFAAAVEAAQEIGTKRLEDEAVRRAYEGYEEPVYYQGERVDVVRKYSDTLLIFLLKGRCPEKFSDRVNLVGRVHQTIEHRAVSAADSRIGELFEPREGIDSPPARPH